MAQLVEWQQGETIFREEDAREFLYLVIEGRVALEVDVPPRGRMRILTLEPGDAFGWSSIFYQKPKTAGATASQPTRALALDASRLRELSETDTRFGYWLACRLLEVVTARLKVTRIQLLDVFRY
jgi:CRP-like cAMP-binding protein